MIIRKSISRKSFTREKGRLVVKAFTDDGAQYLEVLENRFTGEIISVGAYLNYLNSKLENKKREKIENLSELREERDKITDNLYTQIDFTNKILVLLERPELGFWQDMLSVASHDSQYLETSFVEGEGKKYTKHVVYKGWPAIIFCTSKGEDFCGDSEENGGD